jgi:DNA-binding NarL/FixJ family response regulator
MLRIAIADDNTLFSYGLKQILWFEKEFEIVRLVKNEIELFAVLQNFPIDVAIVDVRMPGMDGLNIFNKLHDQYPKLKIIGISMFEDFKIAAELKRIGVQGYLFKTLDTGDLLNYIVQISHGKTVFPEIIQTTVIDHGESVQSAHTHQQLSEREKEIVALIAQGHTSSQIATKLFISVNTVKNHRKNILRKVHANNMQELVTYAIFHNIT